MPINIRFVWEKDNLLSKMRDMKWFCTQVLLKDMIWVAHGDHRRRVDQRYLWPAQLQENVTNKISRVAAAVDGGLGLCTDYWKTWFKTWVRFLRAFSSQGWSSARTEIPWLPGGKPWLCGASFHPKSCLRYFISHLFASYLQVQWGQ